MGILRHECHRARRITKMAQDAELSDVSERAKAVAADFYRLIGKPLGITVDPEGIAAFFVALSRSKQRAIFAFCQQCGKRNNFGELHLALVASVPEFSL